MIRIAMIGCGAIGAAALELLRHERDGAVRWIVLRPEQSIDSAEAAKRIAPDASIVDTLANVEGVDLVVECAGQGAVEQHVLPALSRGIPAIVASVGALSEPGLAGRLEDAARSGQTQVQLIAGAIGGIDALAAARIGGLESVAYTGTKPPRAWKGTPAELECDLEVLTSARCIFEGTAERAARLYPKNANVAAMVALAGTGLQQTRVRLFADPAVTDNIHYVEARGSFGSMELTFRGKPLAANPKTSALTVYSLVRAIRNRGSALSI